MFDRVKWRRRLLGCLNDVIAVKFWLHDGRAVWMAVLLVNCFVLMYGLYVIGRYIWLVARSCLIPIFFSASFLAVLYWYWLGNVGIPY